MLRIVLTGLRADLRRVIAAAVAIVLGVAFLAATLVLGDTMRGGYRDAFVAGNDGLSAVIRSDTRVGDDESAMDLGRVPVALVDQIVATDGIAAAALHIEGRAQILDRHGRPLGGDGPPTLATNWIDDPRLSPWSLAEGRAPDGAGEVVIDRASARSAGYSVGDRALLRTPDPIEVTIVGIATFAGEDSQGPVTQTIFSTEAAQDLFLGDRSVATTIRVTGTGDLREADVVARIAPLLPHGTEVVTAAALSAEQLAELEGDFIGFFQTMLLVFAGVGLVVATLTIHNTFAIIVAQRGRQSALLRAIGASRRQVLTAVAAEAAVVGVVASAAGVSAGIGLAALATWGMDASGFGIPGSLRWSLTSLAVAWSVGVASALAASMLPAIHAARIAPLAAVRELALDRSGVSRTRLLAAGVSAAASLVAVAITMGADDVSPRLAGAGVLSGLVAVVVGGPVLARPVASALGWPVARLRGPTGELARRNAMRHPGRTASTASSLMVGVAIVTFLATTAFSLTTYIGRTVDAQFAGDLVIEQDGFSGPGLSRGLVPQLDALAETAEVVPMATGVVRWEDRVLHPTVTDPAALGRLLDLDLGAGELETMGESSLAVSQQLAHDTGWQLGDVVSLRLGAGEEVDVRVGALFASRDLAGDLIMDRTLWDRHGPLVPTRVVLIGLDPAAGSDEARAAVAAVAAAEAAPAPLDREAYVDRVSEEVDQLIAVMFALLAIAVLIAVMGIGNTMSLSVHERTRELGLLRAVGMARRSLRASVRWESAIVAAFGSVMGLAVGVVGAAVAVRVVASAEAIDLAPAIPTSTFLVLLGLGAAAGVVAGVRPARRAARLDVLEAISAA